MSTTQTQPQPQSQSQSQSETLSGTTSNSSTSLNGVEAFIFDVFGTVVDWRTSVVKELRELGRKHGIDPESVDWRAFAQEWRNGYMANTRRIAQEGASSGSFNVDIMHRQILDLLLTKSKWAKYGTSWTEEEKRELNLVWHRLDGWADAVPWLNELKKHKMIVTLSNGNMRLLIDMVSSLMVVSSGVRGWEADYVVESIRRSMQTYLGTRFSRQNYSTPLNQIPKPISKRSVISPCHQKNVPW